VSVFKIGRISITLSGIYLYAKPLTLEVGELDDALDSVTLFHY